MSLYFFWFFTRWYLKLRFFSNTFWTKIPKSSHSARALRVQTERDLQAQGSQPPVHRTAPRHAAPTIPHHLNSSCPGLRSLTIEMKQTFCDKNNWRIIAIVICKLRFSVITNSIRIQWSVLSFEKGLEVKNLELVHLFSIVCFVYTALVVPTFKVKIKVLVSLIYNN